MGDLIIGGAAIAAGAAGLAGCIIALRRLPGYNARMRRLSRMSATELHAELTRCTGAIMACSRRGDRKGARHAHRAMKPIMRALMAEKAK